MGRVVGLVVEFPEPSTTFTCPECGKEYKTVAGLNKHVEKEHPWGEEHSTER